MHAYCYRLNLLLGAESTAPAAGWEMQNVVFILTENTEYTVGTDGGQKANKYQENHPTPQTLSTLLQSPGA